MFYLFLCLVFGGLFIYYHNYVYLVFLLLFLCLLGKRVCFKLYILCCLAISLFLTFNINFYKSNIIIGEFVKDFEVIESYDNYSIVSDGEYKYVVYNGKENFNKGNKILIKGEVKDIRGSYNDFYNYLNKKNINYEIEVYELVILDSSVSLNIEIVDRLLENKSEKSKSYLKLILFNDKDEGNLDFYNNFSLYSLTYLIAVSGFHINLLLKFFKKLFHNNCIGISLVCFYLYLLDFSISSLRAFLCYVFKSFNKKAGFSLSNLEVVSLIGSVFIIRDPSIIFSYSFIFSFLSCFVLEIFRLYKCKKMIVSIYIYLVNIPLLLISYYKLNVFTVIFGIFLSLPISFLYVFSFIYLFLDKFYLLYEFVIGLFYKLFNVLNKFNLVLVFGKPSVVIVLIYYLFLVGYFIFKERRRKIRFIFLLLLFSVLGYLYYKPVLMGGEKFYFLNVGQGDCSVFFIPNSKEVVIVDTGGSLYKDVAVKEIIPFLESNGVNKIRKVILTHDDFDHVGAYVSLKDNFLVESVVTSSLIEGVYIGEKYFKNLNISEDRDNDGSIVLYGEYVGYDILLMGDASVEIENKIIEKLDGVDVVKIGHHGSDTSSSYEFLKSINGKFAIISVGKNNIYRHPHKDVVNRLNELGYIILRTDENNDIGFYKSYFGIHVIEYFK